MFWNGLFQPISSHNCPLLKKLKKNLHAEWRLWSGIVQDPSKIMEKYYLLAMVAMPITHRNHPENACLIHFEMSKNKSLWGVGLSVREAKEMV